MPDAHFQVAPALSTRRSFLKRLGSAGAFTIVGSSVGGLTLGLRPMTAWGLPGDGDDPVIVNVFLRGGADALNVVVPYGDDEYYRLRRSIARNAGDYTDLDGFFGLNNAFNALMPLYNSGELAFVHAVGSFDPTRSHFVAQPIMDAGFGPGGWLQRALQVKNLANPVSGVTIGSRTTEALAGAFGGIALDNINKYVREAGDLASVRPALEAMYGGAIQDLDRNAVLNAFLSIDQLAEITIEPSVSYPNTPIATDFEEAAKLIKSDIGVRGVGINNGGWDHHSNEVTRMQTVGSRLGEAIATFWQDLGEHRNRVVIVINSEFGRTAEQNGSGGTDHGHGGAMIVVGTELQNAGGGQVLTADGVWPGLRTEDLYLERFSPITTDFRSVFAEVVDRHFGVDDMATAFPGFVPQYLDILPQQFADGDVDGSGVVDDADAQAILDAAAGQAPAGYDGPRGDVSGDGTTGLLDALMVAQDGNPPQ